MQLIIIITQYEHLKILLTLLIVYNYVIQIHYILGYY